MRYLLFCILLCFNLSLTADLVNIEDKSIGVNFTHLEFNQILDAIKDGVRDIKCLSLYINDGSFYVGDTQWNSGEYIDGTKIADADYGDISISSGVFSIDTGVVGSSELGSSGVVAGSYTNADITIDEDGRITAADNGSSSGVGTGAIGPTELASTSVSAGSYTNADITVDEDGRITTASNGSTAGDETDPVYVAWDKDYDDLTNKPTIPTNNNQLTNGAGYQVASDVSTYCETTQDYLKTSENNDTLDSVSLTDVQSACTNDFHNIGGTDATDDTVSGTELDGVFSTTGIIRRTGANTYSTVTDNSTNWDTAYGWGDHSEEGYLTSETSHSDVVVDGDFSSNGILKRTSAGVYGIITDSSSNWNSAYSLVSGLAAGEVTQLENIGSTTISSTQWGYLGALNQGLTTTSSVGFSSIAGSTKYGVTSQYMYMDTVSAFSGALVFPRICFTSTGYGTKLGAIRNALYIHADSGASPILYLSNEDLSKVVNLTMNETTGAVTFTGVSGGTTWTDNFTVVGNISATNLNISNWNTAYNWGDHSSQNYLDLDTYTNADTDSTDDFSGSYNDLTDKPTNIDEDSTDDFSGSYNDLSDVPENIDTDSTDDFSGSYNDLSDVPENIDTDSTDDITTSEMPSIGNDPDVDVAGEIGRDNDDHALRGYDGSAQYVYGQKVKLINFCIAKPLSLDEADTMPVFQNRTPFSFIITAVYSNSDTDDVDFTLKEVSLTDFTSITTIEAITISTDGTSVYYNELTSGIDHTTIEAGNGIVFDNDGTDDPDYINVCIVGYYNGDVA